MNYGALISEAFWLTWRNRFLWFFGLFAGGGFSFNFNVPTNFGGTEDRDTGGADGGILAPAQSPERWVTDNLDLILSIAALVILVVLVFVALSILSQGALVDSVAALRRGEQRRFSLAWRAGVSHFWRVLGLKVSFLLISLGLVIAIGAPVALVFFAVFASTDSVGLIVLFVAFAVLLVIALLILAFVPLAIIGHLALRELVLGERRIIGSIRSGFTLMRRNLGRSLLVWVILVALTLAAGVTLLIVGLIFGLAVFALVASLLAVDFATGAIVVGVAAALILLVPFVVISGAIGAFGSSYWTLAYLRLAASDEDPVPQPGPPP